MDPIENIAVAKDTTFGMILEAHRRKWQIFHVLQENIKFENCKIIGNVNKVDVSHGISLQGSTQVNLLDFDIILMRKDPPVDQNYLNTLFLLEQVNRIKSNVINSPLGIRQSNEKCFALEFNELSPPSILTSSKEDLLNFSIKHKDIIVKPLEQMGGNGIFKVLSSDVNKNVIFETITKDYTSKVLAQKFIPEIISGDKRVIMINGKAIPFGLKRIPTKGEFRGNIAKGAKAEVFKLSEEDINISKRVSKSLLDRGLLFVGLDIIGTNLTEINVTSPTCLREISNETGINYFNDFFNTLEGKFNSK